MDFSLFCSCGQAGYAHLKQRVDACAQQGRCYEFAQCRMPEGCRPAQAALGFWRDGGDYLLYLKPSVTYQGNDPRLTAFFQRGTPQRFSNFQDLSACLLTLDTDTAAPRPHPMPELFCRLNQALQTRVLGQAAAVEAAAFKLYGHICKKNPARPLSLIFYGPTCVGKSELGKAIAPVLNQHCAGEPYRMVWTELNTFTEAHSVYRLTGAPPGYMGYDDPPVLEAVRHNPRTVFMFDELDKAHPEVLKVFMSILDEGRCSARREDEDGNRELDFRRCIFLFTTNTDLSGEHRPLGFAPAAERPPDRPESSQNTADGPAGLARRLFQADETARLALIRSGVLREIAGRFSGLIGFQPLSGESRTAVTARQIAALGREYGLEITRVSPAIAQALTPEDALSLRSTAGVLEGVLTPLFLRHSQAGLTGSALQLAGSPDAMCLLPAR